ncbi:MAG: NACHT domain-containing protein [Anaerolineae bacterium]|nr:NACHT domain-containing protein [Anaerolineae bacterium]
MAYTASLDFRSELFDDPREYEETPLRDCKGQFPNLYQGNDTTRAEFIRDAIAMANTARLFGKPAYLLFGIDHHSNIRDIAPDLLIYGQKVNDPSKAQERAQQQVKNLIKDYIKPLLANCELKWGHYKNSLVAYILFWPLASPQPFSVANNFKHELSTGQCWIRIGESKAEIKREEISPDQAPYCYAYAEVPYVLPSVWQAYFDGLWSDKELDLFKAQGIMAYQELFAVNGEVLQNVVNEFLASDQTLLILTGVAGCGKSAFLQRLVDRWAISSAMAAAEIRQQEEFNPPPEWIPVYLSLRGRGITTNWSLAAVIVDKVNQLSRSAFWEKHPMHPEWLLEYDDLHWLICLDGLDEIWNKAGYQRFLAGLQTFLEKYPRVKVILTTRPDVNAGFLKTRGDVVDIAPLTPEKILRYIQNFPGAEDPERYNEVEEFLRSDPDLWTLCQAPAYLQAAVSVLMGAATQSLEESATTRRETNTATAKTPSKSILSDESVTIPFEPGTIPIVGTEGLTFEEPIEVQNAREEEEEQEQVILPISLGKLLDQVYLVLWEREKSRHLPNKLGQWDEWLERTQYLALKMDGREEKVSYKAIREFIGSKKAISRLLSLGILKRDPPETWLGFATRLTKLYFAAAFLKPYLEQSEDHSEAYRHTKHMLPDFRQELLEILSHISNVNPYPIFQEVNDESV